MKPGWIESQLEDIARESNLPLSDFRILGNSIWATVDYSECGGVDASIGVRAGQFPELMVHVGELDFNRHIRCPHEAWTCVLNNRLLPGAVPNRNLDQLAERLEEMFYVVMGYVLGECDPRTAGRIEKARQGEEQAIFAE